jgi:hypothetical protein
MLKHTVDNTITGASRFIYKKCFLELAKARAHKHFIVYVAA